jgi:nicotinamidase-related amidase
MKKSALIVVDMVADFTSPDGLVYFPENEGILPRIADVADECRKNGALIVFMRHSYRKDKPDKNLVKMRKNCIEGSGGDELAPSLAVDEARDYVLKKRRYSAFFGTDLDLILRENGVTDVIIVGTKTNCCIRATVTDAYNLNYNVVVLSDCVATDSPVVNDVHLSDIAKYLGEVITSGELSERFERGLL